MLENIKRAQSFHEHEKAELKNAYKEELDSKWRMNKLSKQFLIGDQKTFDCEICYMEADIKTITYLECGHYFCRDCLKGYYDYMIHQSGSVQKIKCPN
jgi:late competence protein required for DNA uptake (superfamily II DNA/RNA helicase)